MATTVLELGLSNLAVAAALAALALLAGWWGRRPALAHALGLLAICRAAPMPDDPPPAAVAKPAEAAPAPAPKPLASTNPRGEPLLFETNSTDIRPGVENWWSVSVSPDGKRIATGQGRGNTGGEVKIWDRATGKVTNTIFEPKGVRTVAFSPDGQVLATGNYDGAVRFYDTKTFALRAVGNDGNRSGINGICFFKNGKYLASAGLDNTARIWDVAAMLALAKRNAGDPITAKSVAIFEGHTQGVLSVAVSADGLTLLTGSFDRTARCYDVPDPLPALGEPPLRVKKERLVLQGHNNAIETVAVSPDGQLLATGSWDAQLLIRDRDGKKTEATLRFQSGVMCMAFDKEGKHLAAGSGSMTAAGVPGEIRVWDVAGKKEVAYRTDTTGPVLGVAFTPDAKTVVSVGQDQSVHLWPFAEKDRQSFTQSGLSLTPQPYLAAAVSPTGDLLAVSGEGKSVYIVNRRDNTVVAELTGHDDVVAGIAFSPDGKTLATASYDKSIKLWNAATWKERKTLAGHTGWVLGIAFSPDGLTLATGSYDKSVKLWNVETGEAKATWKDHTAGVRSVAFSPDGKKLVSGGSDRIVRIWNVADGTVLLPLKGHKGAVRSVAFSPDGAAVASGSEDRSVKVWDAEIGKELKAFSTLPDMITAIRFSPKGQTIAAATFQGPIVLLDPLTGRTRQQLRAHNESVSAVAFTDDGLVLISVSQDRTMRQWSAVKPSSAAPVQSLNGKIGIISAMAITPDGTAVVLGGADGFIAVWEPKTGGMFPHLGAKHPEAVAHVAVSNELRIASIGKDGTLFVGGVAGTDAWTRKGRFAAFAPDGKQLAVVDGKDIVLCDSVTGKEVKRFPGGSDNVVRLAFSPDGKRMISAGEETKIRLWNVETGAKLQETPAFGNYSAVTQLAFSPDGTRFAAAAYGPDQPPPDDMTGNFRAVREVRVFTLPKTDTEAFATPPIVFVPQPTDQPITGLDWVSNGQALITPASDGTVRLTELGTNGPREIQRYRAHEAAILASAVSLDGGVFITAGEDTSVRRWKLPGFDPTPGQARLTPPGLGRVWEVLPSPDGKYVVAGGEGDKTFRVFGGVPSSIPVEPDRHGSAFGLAISPDNKFVVTGHEKGEVVVREAATGKPIRVLSGHKKRVASIAFAENGAALVTVGGNRMDGKEAGEAFVWDFAAGTIRHKLDAPSFQWMVAVHPDGSTAAIAAADGKIRLFNVGTGKLSNTIGKGVGAQKTVAFSPDGGHIAAGSADKTARVYDATTGAVIRSIAVPELVLECVRFSPDGNEVVIAAWKGGGKVEDRPPMLAAYSLEEPDAAPRVFPTPLASVMHFAFLPDGKTLIAAGGDNGLGTLRVYDFATAKPLGQFAGHRHWGQSLAVSPDGKRLASTGWGNPADGELRLWDPRGFRPIAEVKVPGENQYISSGAIGQGGKLLVIGGWGQTLTAWDMTDPAKPVLRKQFEEHTAGLRSVSFDASGKRFASTDESGVVKVWDGDTLDLITSFKASTNAVYRAKFTPDGTGLVTVTGNWQAKAKGEMRVWNPKTGQELGRFPDQTREVWDIAFLNGGKQMAAIHTLDGAPTDANVKVWDFEKKEVVRTVLPPGTFTAARCLAASPDGKHLAVGSSTGPVKVLDTATWQEVLNLPDLTNCTFRLDFTRDGNNLLIASGEAAAIAVRLPWAK